ERRRGGRAKHSRHPVAERDLQGGRRQRLRRRDDHHAGRSGFDLTDGTRAPLRDPKTLAETDVQPDGFQTFLQALRDDTTAFQKPVVLVYGDSHYFRIDKPLLDEQGRRLENFTRVETFGDNSANGLNDVHWVKVLVDP